jgi:hypothetical protein
MPLDTKIRSVSLLLPVLRAVGLEGRWHFNRCEFLKIPKRAGTAESGFPDKLPIARHAWYGHHM